MIDIYDISIYVFFLMQYNERNKNNHPCQRPSRNITQKISLEIYRFGHQFWVTWGVRYFEPMVHSQYHMQYHVCIYVSIYVATYLSIYVCIYI